MKSYLQILGTETGDTTPSILAFFDNQRYLFNVGEGTQRFCMEKRVRLGKLTNIFVTRVHWDACGGIPGMLLSLADAGNRKITVHGAKNLTHFMAATRHFVFRMSSQVATNEFSDSPDLIQDENLSVLPVNIYPIHPTLTGETEDAAVLPAHPAKKAAIDSGIMTPRSFSSPGPSAVPMPVPIAVPRNSSRSVVAVPCNSARATPTPIRNLQQNVRESFSPSPFSARPGLKRKADEEAYPSPPTLSDDEAMAYKKEIILQMFKSGENLSVSVGTGKVAGTSDSSDRDRSDSLPLISVPNVAQGKRDHRRVVRLPMARPSLAVTTYICQGPTVKGKFFPDKALALQVPREANDLLYGGRPYTRRDGQIIYPHQVMGPDRSGTIFIIVDCPSKDYVGGLTTSEKFVPHYAELTDNPVAVIVHIIGDDVLDCADYRAWMNRFGPSTQHLIINKKHGAKPIIYKMQATSLHRLSHIDPDVFKIPFFTTQHVPFEYADLPVNTLSADIMSIYSMEPTRNMDASQQSSIWDHRDPEGKVLNKFVDRRFDRFRDTASAVWHKIINSKAEMERGDKHGDDVLICTLGTGAALPSRYRNVSSTLINIPDYGSILLDAGEGTYGQLYRRFNQATEGPNLEDILTRLQMLFISHMHADHHLGAAKVIVERKKLLDQRGGTKPPLVIICPPQYIIWLNELADCEDLGLSGGDGVEFIQCHQLLSRSGDEGNAILDRLKSALDLRFVEAIEVQHAHYSYALSLQHNNGFKIVYSGDCRPNLGLMNLGGDADVLIHEATFEDDARGCHDAMEKRHSTTSEAVIVGGRMRAKWIILTHFSQRYFKVASLGLGNLSPDQAEEQRRKVGLAFDLMAIKIGQMRRMAMYHEALKELYPERPEDAPDLEEGEMETAGLLSGGGDNGGGGGGRRDGRGGRGGGRRGGGYRGGRDGNRGGGGGYRGGRDRNRDGGGGYRGGSDRNRDGGYRGGRDGNRDGGYRGGSDGNRKGQFSRKERWRT